MTKLHATLMVASLVGVTTFMGGCTTVQRGAAAGGALGATAGAIVGHNWKSAAAAGAAIGGGTGAAAGGLAGEAFTTTTRDDLNREMENMRAELDAAERELASLRAAGVSTETASELDRLQRELTATRSELDRSRGELSARASELDRASASEEQLQRTAAERDEAFERLRDTEQRLTEARRQLDVMNTSLREREETVNRLRGELSNMNIQLEETSRGLTLTIVDQLLFNPGSADLNPGGKTLMGRVAGIIQRDFPNRELVVEGHTDNVPIRHSGWRSNWELGAGRALSVLHELVSNHGFDPTRMSATTYGEFRPSAPNATNEGRSANRRSVIVILPERTSLQANQVAGL